MLLSWPWRWGWHLPKDVVGAEVPPRIKRVGSFDTGASVSAVHGAAGAPESPSRKRGSATEAVGVGFEEVKLVCRVLVDGTAEESEEDEEDCSCDEYEGDESEGRPCLRC